MLKLVDHVASYCSLAKSFKGGKLQAQTADHKEYSCPQ